MDEALANLNRRRAAESEGVNRRNESPIAGYSRRLRETDVADQVEGYVVDELQHVQDGIASALSNAIGTDDPLITGLLNLFIQEVIMKPLADALASASGGGGGFVGSVLGSIGGLFGGGRASGGRVNAGSLYRVNEGGGAGRVEGFMPDQSGTIIPLGRMNAARPSGTTVINQSFTLDARGGITTSQLLQRVNDIASEKAAQAGARSYQQSMKDAPGAIQRQQRYGN